MRSGALRWIGLVVVAASACATPRAPDRLRIATGVTDRTGIDTKGLAPPGREWAAPPGTSLADGLTIDEAVAIALWNNPEFHVALTELGIARADLIEAGLLNNPVFSLLFPWGPKQLEFTINWSIDAVWQRPKRIEDARLNAEAIAELLVGSGLRLVADVRLAFFEALVADRRLTLATELAGVGAQAAKIAEGQFRAGDISQFDARLATTDALRLEAARLTRVTARDVARVRLRALLGFVGPEPAMTLVEPPGALTDECGPAAVVLESAMAARPDVRAAEMRIEAAGARAGLERARIVAFTVSLDANAKGAAGFEMGPGLSIELPLLSQNQGRRARAAAELEQAARRYIAVRTSVAAEIATAFAGLAEARATAQLLGGDVGASMAAARQQAERLYAAGEISLVDLLQVRQRLIDIESTRVDTAFGVNRAVVRLEQAAGRRCETR